MHDFFEVDAFGTGPFTGNPLAVVAGAGDLSDEQVARIAAWTNSSETTFLLPPSDERADYRVRILTPRGEYPAGALAEWLAGSGLVPERYVVAQGSQVGRAGRVHVHRDGGEVWIGGTAEVMVRGELAP